MDRSENLSGVFGQSFTELYSPLVETVTVVDETLGHYSVLVNGQELSAVESVQ